MIRSLHHVMKIMAAFGRYIGNLLLYWTVVSIVRCRMKGVAFVDQIVFSFSGNHFSHAVTLGDVDADGVRDTH